MSKKKVLVDEEFFYTFHDRPLVELLSSEDVNENLEDPLSETVVNQLMEFLNDKKYREKLTKALFSDAVIEEIEKDKSFLKIDSLFSTEKTSDGKSEYKIKENIFKEINNDDIREIFQVTHTDEQLQGKEIDDFIKYNRRLTKNVCNKIIELDEGIYYCGIAKMPGVWIASSIRESQSERIVGVKTKIDNRHEKCYSRQQHLVESCSRQLLRSDADRFLGSSKYSITLYKKNSADLARITIQQSKFVIGINVIEQLLLDSIPDGVKDLINTLKRKISDLEIKTEQQESFLKKLFWYKHSNVTKKLTSRCDADLKNILEKCENIRWASIITNIGKPICRYEKENLDPPLKITGLDELENLVETAVRQLMRKNITNFFGPVQFSITAYNEITKIFFPIPSERLFIFTIKGGLELKEKMNQIFEFLNKDDTKEQLKSINIK